MLGSFTTRFPQYVFILLHLLAIIVGVVFAVKADGFLDGAKKYMTAFILYVLVNVLYVLSYIDVVATNFAHFFGTLLLLLAFIFVMLGGTS